MQREKRKEKSNDARLEGKRITVMGLGLHGGAVGTVKWLQEQGTKIVVTDLKSEIELKESVDKLKDCETVEFVLGKHREEDFKDADMVVRNPAVPRSSEYLEIAKQAGVPIEMDSSLFWQHCRSRDIIGVTGSKGKTTAARAIARLLGGEKRKVVTVGVDGVSPLAELKNITADTTVVFELSSWRLEALDERQMSPSVAVVTVLYPDHLNTYDSFDDYVRVKKTIVRYQDEDDMAILNHDDELVRSWEPEIKGKLYWYSMKSAPEIGVLRALPEHVARNMLPAILIAKMRGIEAAEIRGRLKEVASLPHRLEKVGEADGVTFINDSTATIPEATVAALKSLGAKNIVLILGGGDKKLAYEKLAEKISRSGVQAMVFLPGSATAQMFDIIKDKVGLALPMYKVEDMSEAVKRAAGLAKKGDVVLLSPAATSFGLFQHEFDRGDKFKAWVNKLRKD